MTFSPGKFLFAAALLASINTMAQNQNDSKVSTIELNPIDKTAKSIQFKETANIDTNNVNALFIKYFGIDGKDNVLLPKHNTTTKTALTTMRYTQFYKGIRTRFGGATLAVKNGLVSFITGNYYRFQDNPSTIPGISERDAFTFATKFVGAELYKWDIPEEENFIKIQYSNPDTSFMPKGTLVWIEDMFGHADNRQARLAYCFDIYAEKPLSRQEVFVDAVSGKILFSNALIKHAAASGVSRYSGTLSFITAKLSSTYVLYDSSRGDGILTVNMNNGTSYGAATNFASATNTWPTTTAHNIALDAHWGTEKVYDYWLAEHGRNSWDGMGGILKSYVHYGTNFNNAYWDGVRMTYGDGSGSSGGGFDPLTSLDVTAHEIGHGVCQATSDLAYENESGAMNEGFSDCWGATIEHYADPLETDAVAKKTWYIGEEIGGGNPLRRMDFPKLKNDPDTHGGINWYTVVGCTPTGANDHCGVHNNSGVLNKFYFLLTEGGAGTNDKGNIYAVTGLGWTKAPTILYQTELVLSSTATYADCRTASINVAKLLYGPCSAEVKSVTDAWYAVGVGTAYIPCAFIGFEVATMDISEKSSDTACPASTVYTIGVKPNTPLFVGGSPVVTVSAAGGTAVLGKDYTLSATTLTFPAGVGATQFATLTVIDNGRVNDNKSIQLTFSLSAMGSNAMINTSFDTLAISLVNNDSIPTLVSPVETMLSSTRTWDVHTGEEVYFYNAANNNLIAGIKDMSTDLGCLSTKITGAGAGFKKALFSPANRSLKEVTFSPVNDGSATTYMASIYFTNAELASVLPSTLKLLKTEELNDTTITLLNSVLAMPTLSTGTGYVGFSATFTGIKPSSRFMLIDGSLSPTATKVESLDNLKPILSPNPNDGTFTIKGRLKNLYTGQASIVISNMLGQIIHTSETAVSNGFMNAPVSLTQTLSKGVYFVTVTAAEEKAIFHLVLDK